MEAFGLARDRDYAAMIAQEHYDQEQLEWTRLLCQLEAWRESWQDSRCRPGTPMTEGLARESRRLARCAETLLV